MWLLEFVILINLEHNTIATLLYFVQNISKGESSENIINFLDFLGNLLSLVSEGNFELYEIN